MAGAAFFVVVAFFAGAFLAGISYPPFHSAVAEDKKFTIRLTNEQSSNRQSEIEISVKFLLRCFDDNPRITKMIRVIRISFDNRRHPQIRSST